MVNPNDRRRPQPARVHLFAARWSVRAAAAEIGVSEGHLRNCILGTATPNDAVRAKLPALLGIPLAELFDTDLLAREWRGTNDHASADRKRVAS